MLDHGALEKPAAWFAIPAMRIGVMLIACTVMALSGCGLSDQHSFMPKILRQPSAEPRQPEPETDAKELLRAGADTLFMEHPNTVAVSRPRRILGRGFSVCVTAVVAGQLNAEPRPVTLLVIIEQGKLADRRRATSYDGCATETYENVDLAVRQ
jgi:hypothetical protein